jgi:hypothetical protein
MREGSDLKDPSADGRIILKWVFDTLTRGMGEGGGRHGLDRSGSG